MDRNDIDVRENSIKEIDPKILAILLKDKTTKRNIIWATEEYQLYGEGYGCGDEITAPAITGEQGTVIRPRVEKSKDEQSARAREKAEVFTPAWVCNKQNNLIDSAWFGRENVFNAETGTTWITTKDKIAFPNTKGKTWQDYVKANRLEISCGEAPYLSSRYDSVTGEAIPVTERIGLLDRKLRIVSENTEILDDWITWAIRAVQSVYGYDWQGDNVLLARENILYTFAEHYEERFGEPMSRGLYIKVAKIVAWNIWQMDGIKYVVPNSCHDEIECQTNLYGELISTGCIGCLKNDHSLHNGIYSRTYDWPANRSVEFYSFIKKGEKRNGSKV